MKEFDYAILYDSGCGGNFLAYKQLVNLYRYKPSAEEYNDAINEYYPFMVHRGKEEYYNTNKKIFVSHIDIPHHDTILNRSGQVSKAYVIYGNKLSELILRAKRIYSENFSYEELKQFYGVEGNVIDSIIRDVVNPADIVFEKRLTEWVYPLVRKINETDLYHDITLVSYNDVFVTRKIKVDGVNDSEIIDYNTRNFELMERLKSDVLPDAKLHEYLEYIEKLYRRYESIN